MGEKMYKSLVSVVVPTYGRSQSLSRAITSVLNQTYSPIEIIVIDDNGKGTFHQKETEKVLLPFIKKNQISYIVHENNSNGAVARNTGIKKCHGDYITFFDDDDEMLPHKIEEQVKALQSANKKVAASYSGCYIYKQGKKVSEKYAKSNGNLKQQLLSGDWGFFSGSNILFMRTAVEQIGGYDESFQRHQDWEFVVRYFQSYDIVAIDEPLFIKHNDAASNKFRPLDRLTFMQQFLNKFRSDIECYSIEVQNKLYHNRYFDIAIIAANASEYLFMIKVLKQVSSYGVLTLNDCMRLCKHIIFKPLRRT